MIKATEKKIAESVQPVDDTHVLASEETLREMSKAFRDFLKKERNIPAKNSKAFPIFQINAVQYIANIIQVTQALIEQGAIEKDPYGFLTNTVNSYDKANKLINETFIPKAFELIQKKHDAEIAKKEAEGKKVSVEEKELSSANVAKIASEPTEDSSTHVVEILTSTNKRWYFDKINYTLSFKKKDGTIKIITLAKKDSWRATVINLFIKVISWFKEKYNTAKDRAIGVKQSFQWKMLEFKMKLKNKLETTKVSKQELSEDIHKDIEELPANNI